MKTLNDIRANIQPALQKVEQFRLEKLEAIAQGRKWNALPTIIIVLAVLSLISGIIPLAIIFGAIGIVGYVLVGVWKVGRHGTSYISNFKQEIFTAFVQGSYPNAHYAPANYLPRNLFESSRLFTSEFNEYSGEDYFEGKTDSGALFKFSELSVSYSYSHGDVSTNSTVIFHGIFFVLEVPNRVSGQVQILSPDAKSLGLLNKVKEKDLSSYFQRANTVYMDKNLGFEKNFDVYSENEDEAYHILTPALIKSIYDLRYKWNTSVSLSFIDNQIYVALSTAKNFFNPNIQKSVLEDELLDELYEELALCFSVVENLSVKQENTGSL